MNNRYGFRAAAIALLVIGSAAAIAIGAYNAGVAQGIAEAGRTISAQPPAGMPYVYAYRPWGFHFFPIFPIFFFLFFFFVLRGLLWRGPWRGGWGPYGAYGPYGGWGCRYRGMPHGTQPQPPSTPPPSPTPGSGTI